MSKAIRSYPKDQRDAVAARRISGNTKGLGYLAALDYVNRKKESKPKA